MKIIMIVCVWVVLLYAQLTPWDIRNDTVAGDWETLVQTQEIGYRKTVDRISNTDYFVTGILYGKTFIGIESWNGEPEHDYISQKILTLAHLELMRYVAFIDLVDIDHLLYGKKVSVIRLYGNVVSGRRDVEEKIVFRYSNGVRCFQPLNDLGEMYYVTNPKALKGFQ